MGVEHNRGFTIIEMVITALVIGVLACALVPFSLEAVNKRDLESAGEMIAADIRYGQNKALSQQTASFKIHFVPTRNEYRMYLDKEQSSKYETVKLPKGITLSEVKFGDFGSGSDKLYFNAKGTVLRGGTVSLHDNAGNWLFVRVTPVTGRVRISSTKD